MAAVSRERRCSRTTPQALPVWARASRQDHHCAQASCGHIPEAADNGPGERKEEELWGPIVGDIVSGLPFLSPYCIQFFSNLQSDDAGEGEGAHPWRGRSAADDW